MDRNEPNREEPGGHAMDPYRVQRPARLKISFGRLLLELFAGFFGYLVLAFVALLLFDTLSGLASLAATTLPAIAIMLILALVGKMRVMAVTAGATFLLVLLAAGICARL